MHRMWLFSLWVEKYLRRCSYPTIMVVGMVTVAAADVLIAIAIWIMVITA